jgi:TPP-dependent pyruvate/acetoin dehydrogenase alpha subunit
MLENGLKRAAQIDDGWLDRTNARIKAEIATAFGAARLAPFPAPSDAREHLFAEA